MAGSVIFVVSVLVTGSVGRGSVEDNAAEVTPATLVDASIVVVSVVTSGTVVSGIFASVGGVFGTVLTETVVPGNSEMGTGVVSSRLASVFAGVCTVVVVVSGLPSVLLPVPILEASELSAD